MNSFLRQAERYVAVLSFLFLMVHGLWEEKSRRIYLGLLAAAVLVGLCICRPDWNGSSSGPVDAPKEKPGMDQEHPPWKGQGWGLDPETRREIFRFLRRK